MARQRLAFQEVQFQMTSHIRDPDKVQPPQGIEERRLAIYRDLIFNNIAGFIESGFPVIRSILPEQEWQQLIREFLVNYRAQSPYFAEVAKEFLTFAESGKSEIISKYPFFKELAHYEWVELALMIDPLDLDSIGIKDSVDLLNDVPILSPLAWPLAYEYDVHHISKEYQPNSPPKIPSFIIVYRDRNDDVEFTEVNAVTFSLVTIMNDNDTLTGRQILDVLAGQMPQIPRQAIFDNGLEIMLKLMKKDIILGVRS
jgi:hypothetical protein